MTESSPSRRAVLGAAWSVPVVALAVAAPGAAASEQPSTVVTSVDLFVLQQSTAAIHILVSISGSNLPAMLDGFYKLDVNDPFAENFTQQDVIQAVSGDGANGGLELVLPGTNPSGTPFTGQVTVSFGQQSASVSYTRPPS